LTPRGLIPLLGYLRELGVVPTANIPAPVGQREELMVRYADFLHEERGLAEGTIRWYLHVAELLLSDRVNELEDVARLTGADVNAWALRVRTALCRSRSRWVKNASTSSVSTSATSRWQMRWQ
jgi:hypothetical protein